MIEPTETEPVENLEAYARTLNEIARLANVEKEEVLDAPHNTSIGRLDEYRASYPSTMILNWKKLSEQTPPAANKS